MNANPTLSVKKEKIFEKNLKTPKKYLKACQRNCQQSK